MKIRSLSLMLLLILALPIMSYGDALVLEDWITRPAYVSDRDRSWIDTNDRCYSSPWNHMPKLGLPDSYVDSFQTRRFGSKKYNENGAEDPLLKAYSEGYRHWTLCYYHYINTYSLFEPLERNAREFVSSLQPLDAEYFAGDLTSIEVAFPPKDSDSWYKHPIHERLEELTIISKDLPEEMTEEDLREARMCFDLTVIAMLLCEDAMVSESMKFIACHHLMRTILSTELVPNDRDERLLIHESLCRDLWEYQVKWPMLLATAESSRAIRTYKNILGDGGRDYTGILVEAVTCKDRWNLTLRQYAKSYELHIDRDKCLAYALTLPWHRRTHQAFLSFLPEERTLELCRYAVSEYARTAPSLEATVLRNPSGKACNINIILKHAFYLGRPFHLIVKGSDKKGSFYSWTTAVGEPDMLAKMAVCTCSYLAFYVYSYDNTSEQAPIGIPDAQLEDDKCFDRLHRSFSDDSLPPGLVKLKNVLPPEAFEAITGGSNPKVKYINLLDDSVEIVISIGSVRYGIKVDKNNNRSCTVR